MTDTLTALVADIVNATLEAQTRLPVTRQVYTPKEVAELLGVSASTVHNRITNGEIPTLPRTLTGDPRVSARWIDTLLDAPQTDMKETR